MIPAPDHYCLFDTAIGTCGVAWSARGLTRLQLPEKDRAATEKRLKWSALPALEAPPSETARLIADIQRYLAGADVDFAEAAVDLKGADPFNVQIYAAARAIGFGRMATYGELARRAGFP